MGITIQQYRSRIGRFLPKHLNISSTDILDKNEKQHEININLQTVVLLTIAIILPFLLALVQFPEVHSQEQFYIHPLYPTNNLQSIIFSCHVLFRISNYRFNFKTFDQLWC